MKTFRNTNYLIKMIITFSLFVVSFILYLLDIMKLSLFVIVFVICFYLIVHSAYYYVKTMIKYTNDKLIISYCSSYSIFSFAKAINQEIALKDIVSMSNKIDETRRYLCIIIQTKDNKYIIKPLMPDSTIVKIIDFYENK